jgi:hypothetical protein
LPSCSHRTTAIATTVAIGAVFVVLWYGLPFYGRLKQQD